jgi:hypothetical protein
LLNWACAVTGYANVLKDKTEAVAEVEEVEEIGCEDKEAEIEAAPDLKWDPTGLRDWLSTIQAKLKTITLPTQTYTHTYTT